MTSRSLSIQAYARIGGVLLLVSLVAGGFGEGFAPSQLIATGDAAATARHILNSDALFRVGFAGYLAFVLVPNLSTAILQAPQILALLALAIWLLARGVNAGKWEAAAQAHAPVVLT